MLSVERFTNRKNPGCRRKNENDFWERYLNKTFNVALRLLQLDELTLSKKQHDCFDQLATLYNHADRENLQKRCSEFKRRNDQESVCLTMYFEANFLLLECNINEANNVLQEAWKCSASTRKPEFYRILLSSPTAGSYHMKKALPELQDFLLRCFCELNLQCKAFSGSYTGWIFYMKARLHDDLSHGLISTNFEDYKKQNDMAIRDMKSALDEFSKSTTEDRYFGMAHALSRLVMFYLQCGEDASLADHYIVQPGEMVSVEKYMKYLHEIRKYIHNVVTEILYIMVESDFHFRVGKIVEAIEFAERALKLAEEHKCREFIECNRKRRDVYSQKSGKVSFAADTDLNVTTTLNANRVIVGNIHIHGPGQIGDNNTQKTVQRRGSI